MDFILAGLFGIIQGITEFFPISSSGHLVVLHALFPAFTAADQVAFDVALHWGTLVALVFFFRRDVVRILAAWFRSFKRQSVGGPGDHAKLAWLIILGTIPAAIVGYLFEKTITEALRSSVWVGIMLMVGGIAFLLIEKLVRVTRQDNAWRRRDALIVGLAQVLSFVPGISRSGSTIVAGRALGFRHAAAARFSFLLSIPIVFGAGLKKLYEISQQNLGSQNWLILIIGFLAALITGVAAIGWLLRFFERHSLTGFAYYRLVLGAVILIALLF